jgi:nucleotide-binding universal stress UspA family protein
MTTEAPAPTEPTAPAPHRYRIVVALDLSEYAEIVLEHALDQAARHTAPDLHFVTVQESAKTSIDELKQRLAVLAFQGLELFRTDRPEWRARLHLRTGDPAEEIANLAADVRADLIVIGRFGLHHKPRRLGSVADQVLRIATCPALVVGLSEHEVDPPEQCAACVEIREESDGERWFCDAHVAPEYGGMTATMPVSGPWTGGGLMW